MKKLKRLGAMLLCLVMVFGMLPTVAFAADIGTKDWAVFTQGEPNAPKTQEAILQRMIQNERVYQNGWAKIGSVLKPGNYGASLGSYDYNKGNVRYEIPDISTLTYSNKGLAQTVENCFSGHVLGMMKNESGLMSKLPNTEGVGKDVFYLLKHNYANTYDNTLGLESVSMVIFYDFKVEGLPDLFQTPDVKAGTDTLESLREKGITITLGGASDSFTMTADNPNDFESVVSKSYQYSKSTSTATSVSTEYSKAWEKETTVSVNFKIPVIAPDFGASVEESFSYSYGIGKTYGTTKDAASEQSITDNVQVPMPPHTKMDINVSVEDRRTKIPYNGAGRLTYKTLFLFAAGEGHTGGSGTMKDCNKASATVYAFGRDDRTSLEDLQYRLNNVDVAGVNSDMPGIKTWNTKQAFQEGVTQLTSGQPYAPYFGDFYYMDKNTIIKPQQVLPLYPLDNIVPNVEEMTLYEQQEKRLDNIYLEAFNQYDVAYYGFTPALDGHWTIMDADGNDASEYAVVEMDRNKVPYLKTLKTAEKDLYLYFDPDQITDRTKTFTSNTILLTILPKPLSGVTIEGEFAPIILDDGPNTANVSGLTVTAKDENGNAFNTTGRIRWMTEAADGLTINPTTGAISFTKPGDYQIYAVVNGEESNRILLQVLPERQLDTVTISGEIPELYYNSDTEKTFDLSTLTVAGKDQYGDVMALDPFQQEWVLTHPEDATGEYAKITGNTLTGLVVGNVALHLAVKDGDRTVTSNGLTVKVGAKAYASKLLRSGDVMDGLEETAYDLTAIGLRCEDQYGAAFAVPADLKWVVSPNGPRTGITIDAQNKLTVAKGTVPYGGTLQVLVRATSPSAEVETEDIAITFRQQPKLASLTLAAIKPFELKKDQNGYLTDYFTVTGKDQYDKPIAIQPQWYTETGLVFAIDNTTGIITVLQSEGSDRLYVEQDGIQSNFLPIGCGVVRTISGMELSDVPASADNGEVLDLSQVKVRVLDQNNAPFSQRELDDLGVSVTWKLDAGCTGSTLQADKLTVGSGSGNLLLTALLQKNGQTLDCKKFTILVGSDLEDWTPKTREVPAKGGCVTFTFTGDNLKSLKLSDETGTIRGRTLGTAQTQTVTLCFPANETPENVVYHLTTDQYGDACPMTVTVLASDPKQDNLDPGFRPPFWDIQITDWFYHAVEYVRDLGLMKGITEHEFAPNNTTNRAMIVTILHRLAGEKTARFSADFQDVPAGQWYAEAIDWAVEQGVVNGLSADSFGPDGTLSREQLVTMLYRYAGSPAVIGSLNDFRDSRLVSDWAESAMIWAVKEGLINGMDGLLSPQGQATRAQLAAIMQRFCDQ